MDDHRPTSSGRASAAELDAGYARRESLRGADRAETRGVRTRSPVHEGTRDQVRRALEGAGVLFVESDRGRSVMLLNDAPAQPVRRTSRIG
jgi:hypothetical protein